MKKNVTIFLIMCMLLLSISFARTKTVSVVDSHVEKLSETKQETTLVFNPPALKYELLELTKRIYENGSDSRALFLWFVNYTRHYKRIERLKPATAEDAKEILGNDAELFGKYRDIYKKMEKEEPRLLKELNYYNNIFPGFSSAYYILIAGCPEDSDFGKIENYLRNYPEADFSKAMLILINSYGGITVEDARAILKNPTGAAEILKKYLNNPSNDTMKGLKIINSDYKGFFNKYADFLKSIYEKYYKNSLEKYDNNSMQDSINNKNKYEKIDPVAFISKCSKAVNGELDTRKILIYPSAFAYEPIFALNYLEIIYVYDMSFKYGCFDFLFYQLCENCFVGNFLLSNKDFLDLSKKLVKVKSMQKDIDPINLYDSIWMGPTPDKHSEYYASSASSAAFSRFVLYKLGFYDYETLKKGDINVYVSDYEKKLFTALADNYTLDSNENAVNFIINFLRAYVNEN